MKSIFCFTFLIVASVTFGANHWTIESRGNPVIPADALTGCKAVNNMCNLKVGDSYGVGSDSAFTWSFAEPKDITSVQIYTLANTYEVKSVSVKYPGSDEFVALDDSYRASASTGSSSEFSRFASDSGVLAAGVIGVKVQLGTVGIYWANSEEIVVTGHNSDGSPNWKCGYFASGTFERAEDDLKDGFAMTGNDGWSDPWANLIDGNPSSLCYPTPGANLSFAFATPKRLRRVRMACGSGGGFSIDGIYVKYYGTDDYVKLPGSSMGHFTNGNNYLAEYGGEGYFAKNVIAMRVKILTCDSDWRFALGEVEVDGAEGFASALSAENEQAGDHLHSVITAHAEEYPVTVKMCYGDTDCGAVVSAWDHVVEVGVINSEDSPLEISPLINFRSCRYMFSDVDADAWTNPFDLVMDPSGTSSFEASRYAADLIANATWCGGTNAEIAVYYAYAEKGSPLPAYTLMSANAVVGTPVSVTVDGLSELTDYDYSIKFVSRDGFECVCPGSFATGGACIWEYGTYNQSTWTNPAGRLTGEYSSFNLYNLLPIRDKGVGNINSNTTVTCTWAEPKDIERIELYSYGATNWKQEMCSVAFKYAGEDGYDEPMSGSHYQYFADAAGMKMGTLRGTDGLLASNVIGVKFTGGYWANGHAAGIGELAFFGKTHESSVFWEYGTNTVEDFSVPADSLNASEKVTLSGFSNVEHDGVLGDKTDRYNEQTWTWTFSKPHNIRSVELWTKGGTARSAFRIASVHYKLPGDEEWRRISGSSLDLFTFGSPMHHARLYGDSDWVVKNAVALKLTLGLPSNAYSEVAEVLCTGSCPKGMVIVYR